MTVGGEFPKPFRLVGIVLGALGGALLVWGAATLGRRLTPLPYPTKQRDLARRGPYAWVRHPVYGGAASLCVGAALALGHWAALTTALVAVAFFDLKSRREETWLEERYADYSDYRRGTPRRLVPWLY